MTHINPQTLQNPQFPFSPQLLLIVPPKRKPPAAIYVYSASPAHRHREWGVPSPVLRGPSTPVTAFQITMDLADKRLILHNGMPWGRKVTYTAGQTSASAGPWEDPYDTPDDMAYILTCLNVSKCGWWWDGKQVKQPGCSPAEDSTFAFSWQAEKTQGVTSAETWKPSHESEQLFERSSSHNRSLDAHQRQGLKHPLQFRCLD